MAKQKEFGTNSNYKMNNNLSICIPTYKRVEYLIKLVNSIPEKYPVCISDNGNYVDESIFKRGNIKFMHIDNVVSMFSNWNNAISMVETDWFIMPGDDDILLIDVLEMVESYIMKHNNCAFLAFGYNNVDDNDISSIKWLPDSEKELEPLASFDAIKYGAPFSWPAIVVNTEKSRSIGNFDEDFEYTASDNLYLQTLALKYPIALIDKVLGENRVWKNSTACKTIATKGWFEQLKLWQDKICIVLKNKEIDTYNPKEICDNITYNNLIAALGNIRSIKERIRFIGDIGWPKRISFNKKLKLIKKIIL